MTITDKNDRENPRAGGIAIFDFCLERNLKN